MVLLRVAALAACVLFASPAFAQEARGTALNINAEGVSEAWPDMATIELGVRTNGRTAEVALEENNRRIASLIAALRREGVEERDGYAAPERREAKVEPAVEEDDHEREGGEVGRDRGEARGRDDDNP